MSSGTQNLVLLPGPWKGIAPVIIILVFLFLAAPASAHPPSDMILSYESGELTATITHGVSDPTRHYVNRTVITINGVPLDTIPYESQPPESPFSYQYQVPADPGDVIEVTADCNIAGSITRDLVVGMDPGPETPPLVLWPYHALFQVLGFIFIIAAVLLVQFGKKMQGWYRWHKRLAHTGAFLIIIALAIGVAMVELSGGPHIRVPHAALGITTIALLVLTILLGYAKEKIRPPRLYLRTVHIAAGLVTILFLVITIILGLMTAGLV
jgi:hypothetical protein